jgi:putative inorganic carbon (HCO3(-)) transporter
VLPFRIPIDTGSETSYLLIPLYLVIGGGVLAEAVASFRGDAREIGAPSGFARWLAIALAASIVLYAVQAAYSSDISRAAQNVAFFLIPFTVLFGLLREVEWDSRLLRYALLVVIGESLLLAGIGIVQHEAHHIFWNSKTMESNEFDLNFRVNSLFWDPNVLGRYLVLAILLLCAYMVWTREARRAVATAATSAVLLAALVLTFSQSSLVALLAGLVALTALRWGLRWGVAAIVVATLAGIGLVGLSGADVGSEQSLNIRSSGRAGLVRGGLDLATNRPLAGYGSGSFQVEFSNRFPEEAVGTGAVSHTEPVTVAAEQGLVGLLPYAALLLVAFATLLAVPSSVPVARSALVGCFAAMVVHSLAYAGLLIDPVTWALLGVGLALAGRPDASPAPAGERDVTAARPVPAPAT